MWTSGRLSGVDERYRRAVRLALALAILALGVSAHAQVSRATIDVKACPADGMPEEEMPFGSRTVIVGRSGLVLSGSNKRVPLSYCPEVVALVRVTSVEPPDGAAPEAGTRHFLELFTWRLGRRSPTNPGTYFLEWTALEASGDDLRPVAQATVTTMQGRPEPGPPPDLDTRRSFEMMRSGHVRWKVEGDPPKRGWIMRSEAQP